MYGGGRLWFSFFFVVLLASGSMAATFTFSNNCAYTVWPGTLAGAGHVALPSTGFSLLPGESSTLSTPDDWSGRFWGRTLCSNDQTGRFSCLTGDCGSGTVACSDGGAAPPATLAEFTLNGDGGVDFYDVSLVDGYNLPMLVVPQGVGRGDGNCTATGCVVDINGICPSDLVVVAAVSGGGEEGVACRSACERYGSPEYCCSGSYGGGPASCRPTNYSEFFKNACPKAYSYAYDDSSSTFTCPTGVSYIVTFCPTTTSQKSGGEYPQAALTDATMVFLSGEQVSAAITESPRVSSAVFILLLTAAHRLLRRI